MRNDEVASVLEEFADLLEAKGVDYKPRSYRLAAETVRDHRVPVETLDHDELTELDRVGDAIAGKIVEYVETGEIAELTELREELPVDIEALTAVEGVGPKTVGTLYEALGVTTLDDLETAAREGRIREVSGFGQKTEANILDSVAFAREARGRELLGDARPLGERLRDHLAGVDGVERAELAGSLRRWRETIGDVDVLVATDDPARAVDALREMADDVVEAGETKASVRVDGIRVDLRVTDPSEFGAALQYFTGSWDHNVALRNRAIERGLRMNEYGVFDVSGVDDADHDADDGQRVGVRVAGETEAEMYEAVDHPLVPPEVREGTGEVAAADEGRLPDLLGVDEVRGDLHTHTTWSDGHLTVEEMAAAAAERGHDYVAITDHATGPGMVAGVGVDDDDLLELAERVRAVDETADVRVLTGVEANVDADGALSVADEVLEALDVVVAAPHSGLRQDREPATDRLVRAVDHPETDVLGHPTGRLIAERPGLSPDVEAVAEAAADAGVALEVNANPHRLDLSGEAVRVAVEAGARIAVDTDAHDAAELDNLRYGVHTARRGWAESADVLNALPVEDLLDALDIG